MAFQRFIVCGDSYSEGMTDEVIDGKYRGWADRVADVMTTAHPDFTYVNLAVRGKLIAQVVQGQVPVALKLVTGKETLVSFHAGANDALRPGYQASIAIPLYQDAVRLIAKSGATLMLFPSCSTRTLQARRFRPLIKSASEPQTPWAHERRKVMLPSSNSFARVSTSSTRSIGSTGTRYVSQ